MDPFWKKIARINSRLVPYALALLLILIILELFFHLENPKAKLAMEIADYIIITVFVIDLIFLAVKARSTRFFFSHYWLDLIAVFPFGLFFKLFSEFYRGFAALESVTIGQGVLHESLEAEKEVKVIAKEGRLIRYLRVIARMLRVLAKSRLFQDFHEKYSFSVAPFPIIEENRKRKKK